MAQRGPRTAMRLLATALVVFMLAGCATPAPSDPPVGSSDPSPSTAMEPAWSFTAVDGTTYNDTSPAGNATALFFMATWCSSCRQKAPVVAAGHEQFAERGLRTFSLDFDASEKPADIEAWQTRYEQNWPHGIDTGLRLQRHFGVTSQSTVVILDAQGEVVKTFGYGSRFGEASYAAAIEEALGRSSTPTSA